MRTHVYATLDDCVRLCVVGRTTLLSALDAEVRQKMQTDTRGQFVSAVFDGATLRDGKAVIGVAKVPTVAGRLGTEKPMLSKLSFMGAKRQTEENITEYLLQVR